MIHQLFDFIQCSPTASHTAATVRAMLVQAGLPSFWSPSPGTCSPAAGITPPGA